MLKFSDIANSLALNAFEITQITDRVSLECEKRNENFKSIERSNESMEISLTNMENKL